MNDNNAVVRHDESRQCYVLAVDGEALGVASYEDDGDRRVFSHTEVD